MSMFKTYRTKPFTDLFIVSYMDIAQLPFRYLSVLSKSNPSGACDNQEINIWEDQSRYKLQFNDFADNKYNYKTKHATGSDTKAIVYNRTLTKKTHQHEQREINFFTTSSSVKRKVKQHKSSPHISP